MVEELLFTFAFVLLLAPADGGSDDVRNVCDSMWELEWVAAMAVEDNVMNSKSNGVTIIIESYFGECGDMVMLGPFREAVPHVHTNNCPVINNGGSAEEWREWVLLQAKVFYHCNRDWLFQVW